MVEPKNQASLSSKDDGSPSTQNISGLETPGVSRVSTTPDPMAAGVLPLRRLGVYDLIEMIGEGGMGAVWKAKHSKLDKLVALKVLPAELTSNREAVSRFEREMRAVGKLDHPNILRALDAGEAEGVHYLVLEYVDGIDLATLIQKEGPRSIPDACRIIRDAAMGLAHAHAHGLVHRDVKPSNIMLSKDGTAKILDLGLARLQNVTDDSHLTIRGQVMGTPDFMAPEQWDDTHAVDARADLYSLGCTLGYLLTGRAPFADPRHRSLAQKMKAHLMEGVPPIRELLPQIPVELEELYTCLTSKRPDQRLQTADELVERLNHSLDSCSSLSPATTVMELPRSEVSQIARPRSHGTFRSATGRKWLLAGGFACVAIAALAIAMTRNARPSARAGLPTYANDAAADNGTVAQAVPANTVASSVNPHVAAAAPRVPVIPFNAEQARASQQEWAAYLQLPSEWANSIGMKFRLIPPGEWMMGHTLEEANEALALNPTDFYWSLVSQSSTPRHRVRLASPFYLAETELTQGVYEKVMGQNPAFFSSQGDGKDLVQSDDTVNLPVENISAIDAALFCTALSERDGVAGNELEPSPAAARPEPVYRLPTEAEWEFACRAGTAGPWNVGSAGELQTVAWFSANSGGKTHPVASLPANAFGLFDMHGNILEWCQDYFDTETFTRSALSEVAIDPRGPAAGSSRVLRGGTWDGHPIGCGSSFRYSTYIDYRNSYNGLRVALDVATVRKLMAKSSARPTTK